MWQRFTERARKVIFYAQEEAQNFGDGYVSTEHLLLGLVRENDSVAARVLERMGVSLTRIRAEVEKQLPKGETRHSQDMSLTPRAKRVIDLAYDEARNLDNNYIGTEHLLLGLIREGDGLAGRVLAKLGVELDRGRREVMAIQAADGPSDKRKKQGFFKKVFSPAREEEIETAVQWARFVQDAVEAARREAGLYEGSDKVEPLHLLIGVLDQDGCTAVRILKKTSVDVALLRTKLDAMRGHVESTAKPTVVNSEELNELFGEAEELAGSDGPLRTEHLVLAMLQKQGSKEASLLENEFGVTADKFKSATKDFYKEQT